MTIKGGTNKACSACKYQRRKCSEECILSPYFPADQPKRFQNAHRLFGVCNIKRILKKVSPEQRDDAMSSIIFESDMRAKYPVEGCLGVAKHYEYLVCMAMEELRDVNMKLALCRDQYLFSHHQISPPKPSECPSVMKAQKLPFGVPSFSDEILPLLNDTDSFPLFDGNGDGIDATHVEDNSTKNFSIAIGVNDNVNLNALDAESNLVEAGGLSNFLVDYDDIPFDAISNDKQSFIRCKEECEQSSMESSFKGTKHIERLPKNELKYELKNAAACFRLTTVK